MSNSKRKVQKAKISELKKENLQARRLANDNLKAIDKPRKPINASFTAKYNSGECSKCFYTIQEGETVRFNNEGELIHVRHEVPEATYTFCDRCFLTLPCECDS